MTAQATGRDAANTRKVLPKTDTSQRKAQLRLLSRERRGHSGDGALDEARTAALLATLDHDGFTRPGRVVACYASVPGEPDSWAVIDGLGERGVRVLLPVLRREPDWAWYAGRQALRPSWHDIPEPAAPRLGAAALGQADAIVMPGLAGTPSGDRLGTGGGWYDRALAFAAPSARTYLLLDDADVLDELPTEPWDRPVDVIVTPSRVLVTADERRAFDGQTRACHRPRTA